MPDWAMILVKCVLWWAVLQPLANVFDEWRGCERRGAWVLWVSYPVAALVVLAALEGWITP